jgi:hypothetical protein
MSGIFIHTYLPLTFYPQGVAEASQINLRDTLVLQKFVSCEDYCRRNKWEAHRRLIAVYIRCKCCYSFSRLLRHPWRKERGAFVLSRAPPETIYVYLLIVVK